MSSLNWRSGVVSSSLWAAISPQNRSALPAGSSPQAATVSAL